jgi:serine/threonine protein phosphatase PrpC
MKRFFEYDNSEESDKYFDETQVDNSNIKLSACSVPNGNGKPNEDAFVVVNAEKLLWIGVFDGTTSLRTLDKLQGMTGARFASNFLKDHFINNEIGLTETPKKVLLGLNTQLLEEAKKLGGKLEDTHSLPAAMVTLVKIDMDKLSLDFANVGDTWITIYDQNGGSELVTKDTNKKFDDEMFELIQNKAASKGLTNRKARQEKTIKQALYEMYLRRNNNPNGKGSGLVNGDPNVEMYIQEGKVDLSDKKAVLVGTDGLEILGKLLSDISYRSYLWENYSDGGFKKLINLKKESEDNDPDWKFPRYKHSDDATGVMVRLN